MVFRSMSDIRTKLLLGTSIGALAMIFVMAAGVDQLKTNVSVVESSTPILMGHVTAVAVHADGSMSYVQGDNAIQNLGRDAALLQLFDGTAASATGEFDCVRIGTGDGTAAGGIDGAMGTTNGPACDDDNALSNVQAAAGNANVAEGDIIATFPALQAGDLTGGSVTITEATLENGANVVISHVALGASITGNLDTVITITYTMTLT